MRLDEPGRVSCSAINRETKARLSAEGSSNQTERPCLNHKYGCVWLETVAVIDVQTKQVRMYS